MKRLCILATAILLVTISTSAFADRPMRNRPVATKPVLSVMSVEDGQAAFMVDENGTTDAAPWEVKFTVATDLPVTWSQKTGRTETGSSFTVGLREGFSLRIDPQAPPSKVTVTDNSGVLKPVVMDLTWLYRPTKAVGFSALELELYDNGPPWSGKVRLMPVDAEGRFAPFGGDWRNPRTAVVGYSDGKGGAGSTPAVILNYTSSGVEFMVAARNGCPSGLTVTAGWEGGATQSFSVPVDCANVSPTVAPRHLRGYFLTAIGCLAVALGGWLVYKRTRKMRSVHT